MSKNILFYSKQCEYSNKILQKIDTNLDNLFIKVCIDDENIEIPSFITVVPTIFLTNEKKILIDDEVEIWIENNTELGSLSSNFSDMFSSLDDNFSNLNYKNYSLINENNQIYTPKEEDLKKNTLNIRNI